MVYINRKTQEIKDISPEGESVEGMSRVQIGSDWSMIVYSAKSIRIFNQQGECTHTHQVLDKITCVSKGHSANRILFCVKDSAEKNKQNIYIWDVKNDTQEYVCSILQEASIQGLFETTDGRVLCWDDVQGRPTFLYWYENSLLHGPFQNPNLFRSPRDIIAEPDGVVFGEKDSVFRWNLAWGFPQLGMDEEADILEPEEAKKLILQPISSVSYVLENFPAVLAEKRRNNAKHASEKNPVFMESARHGMNLFYRHEQESHVLVWVGAVMRDFSSGVLFENGCITLKKNRELIVLQLMKGDTEVSLQDLFA